MSPQEKRAHAEGFEAAANGQKADTFYMSLATPKEQRDAYRQGYDAGSQVEERSR